MFQEEHLRVDASGYDYITVLLGTMPKDAI